MNSMRTTLVALVAVPVLGCSAAFAAGPVDGSVDAVWWSNDLQLSEAGASVGVDAAAPGYRGELWLLDRYGFRAAQYNSDLDELGLDSQDSMSLDFMWKAFAPTENNYVAVGLGWQDFDLTQIGLADNTAGARLNVEGQISIIKVVQFYGLGSYMPSLDDSAAFDPLLGRFEDLSAQEYELGVRWTMGMFFHLRAGYRKSEIDFTRMDPLSASFDGSVDSDGFLLGLGVHF